MSSSSHDDNLSRTLMNHVGKFSSLVAARVAPPTLCLLFKTGNRPAKHAWMTTSIFRDLTLRSSSARTVACKEELSSCNTTPSTLLLLYSPPWALKQTETIQDHIIRMGDACQVSHISYDSLRSCARSHSDAIWNHSMLQQDSPHLSESLQQRMVVDTRNIYIYVGGI